MKKITNMNIIEREDVENELNYFCITKIMIHSENPHIELSNGTIIYLEGVEE